MLFALTPPPKYATECQINEKGYQMKRKEKRTTTTINSKNNNRSMAVYCGEDPNT